MRSFERLGAAGFHCLGTELEARDLVDPDPDGDDERPFAAERTAVRA
jgi:hypothetical protein